MPSERELQELMQLLQLQQANQGNPQSLEDFLYQVILSPDKPVRHRVRIVDDPENMTVFDIREGISINEFGQEEEVQELIINVKAFDDGTSMNIYGIVKCLNCGSVVHEENIMACARCGCLICIVQGCSFFSKSSGRFFCSKRCRFLGYIFG